VAWSEGPRARGKGKDNDGLGRKDSAKQDKICILLAKKSMRGTRRLG